MNRLLRGILLLAVLLVVAVLVLRFGRQPEPFPVGSQSAQRLLPGVHEVARLDHQFVDRSRPTAANGDYAGEAVRRLQGSIWYPVDNNEGPYPLVVFSHGFSSVKEGGAYLAEHLAGLGYVVVAADYPLTKMAAPGSPNARDVVNQPADISFLIDTLIAQSADPQHVLAGKVDGTRIGAMGISLGGMTTTLLAYHPQMGDTRIGAALSIAGPTFVFNEAFFREPSLPFLMLAADDDALVPWADNAATVLQLIPGAQLVTVAGGSHTGFSGPSAPLRWLNNPDVLGCYVVMENLGEIDEEPWYEELGTPEQGIRYDAEMEMCTTDPLPASINVLRQQMITQVVVASFFQSQFAPSIAERDAAQAFLSRVLPAELKEVSYTDA